MQETIDNLHKNSNIDCFVIDEVHCVSHWGQDFRKDYLHLNILKQKYPKVPLLGLTATATVKVKADIAKMLGIAGRVLYFQSSYNRPNLVYEIRHKHRFFETAREIAGLIKTKFTNQTGIIYCQSIKECE